MVVSYLWFDIAKFVRTLFQNVMDYDNCHSAEVGNAFWSSNFIIVDLNPNETVHDQKAIHDWRRSALPEMNLEFLRKISTNKLLSITVEFRFSVLGLSDKHRSALHRVTGAYFPNALFKRDCGAPYLRLRNMQNGIHHTSILCIKNSEHTYCFTFHITHSNFRFALESLKPYLRISQMHVISEVSFEKLQSKDFFFRALC